MPDFRFVVFAARRKPPTTSWSRAAQAGGHRPKIELRFRIVIRRAQGHRVQCRLVCVCEGSFAERRAESASTCQNLYLR